MCRVRVDCHLCAILACEDDWDVVIHVRILSFVEVVKSRRAFQANVQAKKRCFLS